jgi:hypothetical protein
MSVPLFGLPAGREAEFERTAVNSEPTFPLYAALRSLTVLRKTKKLFSRHNQLSKVLRQALSDMHLTVTGNEA